MKLVCGDQVIENATVTVQPHNKPQRAKQLIELTVPADASNGGYAVRQLLGQDPDIGAKSVVMLEVSLTSQQIERLKNITEEDLRDIRNGVNPAMIYGVRVYDSEPIDVEEFIVQSFRNEGIVKNEQQVFPKWLVPLYDQQDTIGNKIICIRRDSETSSEMFCEGGRSYLSNVWDGHSTDLSEITEQEAQAIIAHSVKPTGDYLGCVQWFQHSDPNVIVRRNSHDRCTYFDQQLVTPDILWDYHMSQWVKSGQWTEITQQEAERRIEQNRKPVALLVQDLQSGMCKREQFAGGGTPSPRSCDVCLEGPCPRVIPVQTEDTDSPAMQALRKLAQQCGIDPTGLNAEQMADRVIEHNRSRPYSLSCGSETCFQNGKQSDPESAFLQAPCRGCDETQAQEQMIAANVAELSKLHKTVERSFQQLPADRDAVIRPIDLAAAKDDQMQEFPVEQIEVPRACIDQVSKIDKADCWNAITANNVWNATTWAARRDQFKIRCLPQHLPPVRNAAEPKPIQRNIPNLAFVGVDWASRPDIGATVQVTQMSHMLKLQKVLTPGVWLYLTTLDGMLQLMIVDNDVELSAELPAVCLSQQTHFKTPIEWREPVLPKDYGKTVWWHDVEALTHPTHQSGRLVGASDSGSVFVIDPHDKAVAAGRSVYKKKRLVFIVDHPTEGF